MADELASLTDMISYKKLAKDLKEYGVEVKPEALKSIVSPKEFSILIKNSNLNIFK